MAHRVSNPQVTIYRPSTPSRHVSHDLGRFAPFGSQIRSHTVRSWSCRSRISSTITCERVRNRSDSANHGTHRGGSAGCAYGVLETDRDGVIAAVREFTGRPELARLKIDSMVSDTHAGVQQWVERLIGAAKCGELIDLANGEPCDPAGAETWSDERTLPAAALRELLTYQDLAVDPWGLRIRGARIIDDLDLAHITFNHPLHLSECRIEGDINMNYVSFNELTLNGTHTRTVTLDGYQMEERTGDR